MEEGRQVVGGGGRYEPSPCCVTSFDIPIPLPPIPITFVCVSHYLIHYSMQSLPSVCSDHIVFIPLLCCCPTTLFVIPHIPLVGIHLILIHSPHYCCVADDKSQPVCPAPFTLCVEAPVPHLPCYLLLLLVWWRYSLLYYSNLCIPVLLLCREMIPNALIRWWWWGGGDGVEAGDPLYYYYYYPCDDHAYLHYYSHSHSMVTRWPFVVIACIIVDIGRPEAVPVMMMIGDLSAFDTLLMLLFLCSDWWNTIHSPRYFCYPDFLLPSRICCYFTHLHLVLLLGVIYPCRYVLPHSFDLHVVVVVIYPYRCSRLHLHLHLLHICCLRSFPFSLRSTRCYYILPPVVVLPHCSALPIPSFPLPTLISPHLIISARWRAHYLILPHFICCWWWSFDFRWIIGISYVRRAHIHTHTFDLLFVPSFPIIYIVIPLICCYIVVLLHTSYTFYDVITHICHSSHLF